MNDGHVLDNRPISGMQWSARAVSGLRAELTFRGLVLSGLVLSIDDGTVRIATTTSAEATVAPPRIGESVLLRVLSDTTSVLLSGTGVSRSDTAVDTAVLGIEVPLVSVTDAALEALFNRRAHVRVQPVLGRSVLVTMRTPQATVDGHLHDVSVSGISVIADVAAEARLASSCDVELETLLPGATEFLHVAAQIRNRRCSDGSKVLYGLQFVGPAPLELVSYVLQRQRSLDPKSEAPTQTR